MRPLGSDVFVEKTAPGKLMDGETGEYGLRERDGVVLAHYAFKTQFGEVLAVGPACRYLRPEFGRWYREDAGDADAFGETVWCPEAHADMAELDAPYWTMAEAVIIPFTFADDGTPTPLETGVVVRMDRKDTGGIEVDSDYHRLPDNRGEVTAVGPNVRCVGVGNNVITPTACRVMAVKGVPYGLMREDEILAVVGD